MKHAVCNTCTLKLVSIAYDRSIVFKLIREPLKLIMRIFSILYRIDPSEYSVRTRNCYGCIRFYKTALKEKSALFNFMNRIINPVFDRIIEKLITDEELRKSKEYAAKATEGALAQKASEDWMRRLKTGF